MPEYLEDCEPVTPFVGELSCEADARYAAELVAKGKLIAVKNGPVWAVWLDAVNESAVGALYALKERDPNSPLGLTLDNEEIMEFVDTRRIHPKLADLLNRDPQALRDRLGGLAFIRFPLQDFVVNRLPACVLSKDTETEGQFMVQNWDPAGSSAEMFVRAARQLKNQDGRQVLPAVSSLNPSSTPEYVSFNDGMNFASEHGLAILADRQANEPPFTGSFPIIILSNKGIELSRQGNVDKDLIARVLGEYTVHVLDTAIPAIDDPRALVRQPLGLEHLPVEIAEAPAAELRPSILKLLLGQQGRPPQHE